MHDNICTDVPYNFKLPGSYLFDFDFNGNEIEYPYTDDVKLFDINKIIESVNNQQWGDEQWKKWLKKL